MVGELSLILGAVGDCGVRTPTPLRAQKTKRRSGHVLDRAGSPLMSTPFLALLLPGVNGKIYASKEADPGLQDVFGNFRSMMLERGAEQMYNVECAPKSSRRGLPPNSSRRALPPPLELA